MGGDCDLSFDNEIRQRAYWVIYCHPKRDGDDTLDARRYVEQEARTSWVSNPQVRQLCGSCYAIF